MKLQLGDAHGALALYRAVLDLAHATNDGEREMRAHGNLSFVYRLLGDLEPAVSHQQQAVEQAAALKDVFMEGRGNLDLAMTLRLRCAWLGWSSFPRQQPHPRPAPAPPPPLSLSASLSLSPLHLSYLPLISPNLP